MQIPLFANSLAPYQDAIAARLAEVAASRQYILGPELEAFEREFAESSTSSASATGPTP